jgi:hypothetical protein
MRIHPLAMVVLLTATISTGCDKAQEVRNDPAHQNVYGCDQCHGYPPPPFFPNLADATHPKGLTPAMCTVCHPATVLADGHTINATLLDDGNGPPHIAHRDGQVEVAPWDPIACDSCHALPPDTGRHVFHVTARGVACSTCHKGYDPATHLSDDTLHMNGRADVVLQNDTVIEVTLQPDNSWPDSACATCHASLPTD